MRSHALTSELFRKAEEARAQIVTRIEGDKVIITGNQEGLSLIADMVIPPLNGNGNFGCDWDTSFLEKGSHPNIIEGPSLSIGVDKYVLTENAPQNPWRHIPRPLQEIIGVASRLPYPILGIQTRDGIGIYGKTEGLMTLRELLLALVERPWEKATLSKPVVDSGITLEIQGGLC